MLFEGGYDPGIKERYPAVYFGLFVDGRLAGVNSGHFTSRVDYRSRGLCVLPEFRGQGFGVTLLEAVVKHAREAGAARVWSYPRESAWPAYEKAGFCLTDRRLRENDRNHYAFLELRAITGVERETPETYLAELKERKEVLASHSPTLCLAKWKQVNIYLQTGHNHSCHHVRSHRIDKEALNEPAALHNTPQKISARKEMLSGKRPAECSYCWRMEDVGELSDRVHKSSAPWAWPSLKEVVTADPATTLPTYVEVSFDHSCQFKCMYCGPDRSTKWEAEIREFGPYQLSSPLNRLEGTDLLSEEDRRHFTDTFWRWWPELSGNLQHIRITGGEPFLSPETFRLIDELIARPRPRLEFSINTNLGFMPTQLEKFLSKIQALRESVRAVHLYTSIDSVGAQAEYIRFGLQYDKFRANLREILSRSPGITLDFMVTVNLLSFPGMKGLMEMVLETKREFPGHRILVETPLLTDPYHMSWKLAPASFITYVDDALAFMKQNLHSPSRPGFLHVEVQKLQRIRTVMQSPRSVEAFRKKDFYDMFREYDRRRGTNFLQTFPELKELWEESEGLSRSRTGGASS
jgi:GNAT superfamily N-acetyltransferase/organic radical activating enzyme